MANSQYHVVMFNMLLRFPYERFSDFDRDWQRYQKETGSLFFRRKTESAVWALSQLHEQLPPEQPYHMIDFRCVHAKPWRKRIVGRYQDFDCSARVQVRCKDGVLICSLANIEHTHLLAAGAFHIYPRSQRLTATEENAVVEMLTSFSSIGHMRSWILEKFGKCLNRGQSEYLIRKYRHLLSQDQTQEPVEVNQQPDLTIESTETVTTNPVEPPPADDEHPAPTENLVPELPEPMSADQRLQHFEQITQRLFQVLCDLPEPLFLRRCSQLKKYIRWVRRQNDLLSTSEATDETIALANQSPHQPMPCHSRPTKIPSTSTSGLTSYHSVRNCSPTAFQSQCDFVDDSTEPEPKRARPNNFPDRPVRDFPDNSELSAHATSDDANVDSDSDTGWDSWYQC